MFKVTGDDLRQLRVFARLSGRAMAEKLGVTRTTIQNYENGVSEPKISDYINWVIACNVDVNSYLARVLARKDPQRLLNLKELRKEKSKE